MLSHVLLPRRATLLIAGLTGFLGIALGAFGAHVLKGTLELHQSRDIWNTALLYHLIHAPALLWLARGKCVTLTPLLCWSGGVFLFSGSLYALALTGIQWLGAITPLGGLLLMLGWLWVAFAAYRSEE
jgi:uncharacterized membrane protein YgdD (TMEM256/DUF423 family)